MVATNLNTTEYPFTKATSTCYDVSFTMKKTNHNREALTIGTMSTENGKNLKLLQNVVPGNIHTLPMEGHWEFWAGEGLKI